MEARCFCLVTTVARETLPALKVYPYQKIRAMVGQDQRIFPYPIFKINPESLPATFFQISPFLSLRLKLTVPVGLKISMFQSRETMVPGRNRRILELLSILSSRNSRLF